MELSRDFKLRNYTVEERLEATQEIILYKMIRDGYKPLHVCELYPQEIVSREDSGRVVSKPGLEASFEEQKARFKTAADDAKRLGYYELIRIEEIFEENNTCYYAFEPLTGDSFTDFLQASGGKVDYKTAFQLISPLALSLSGSFDKNVYYRTEAARILYCAGKLRLNTPFRGEYTAAYIIEDIANIYYTLITGQQYVQILARPSQLGITLPQALDNLLYNVLFSNPVYPSVTAFYQDLKNAVDNIEPAGGEISAIPPAPAENSIAGSYTPPQTYVSGGAPAGGAGPVPYHDPTMYNGPKKSNTGKIVAGCGALGCLGLIVIIALIGVFTSRIMNSVGGDFGYSFAENWDFDGDMDYEEYEWIFDEEWESEDWDSTYFMYETYAFQNGVHFGLALNDSVAEDGTYAYYPVWNDNQWQFIKEEKATGQQDILAYDIFPTFMDISGNTLVYADALNDYNLYAMDTATGDFSIFHAGRSAYPRIYGGDVYFSNLEDWCSLYRVSINGGGAEKLNDDKSEYLLIQGDRLYYLNLFDNFNTYAMDLNTHEEVEINDIDSDNLVAYNDMLYYINYDTRNIEVMNAQGVNAGIYDSIEAYCFDIQDGIIYYSDYDGHGIFSYTPITGEKELISSTQTNYLRVCGDKIYFYDYNYGNLNSVNLATRDQRNLYTGGADYTRIPSDPLDY